MKKNLLLLLCLGVNSGSVSSMQKFPKVIEEDLFEAFLRCANRHQKLCILNYKQCDELREKRGAPPQEIGHCKWNVSNAIKQEWEDSGCATIGRVLQYLSKNN